MATKNTSRHKFRIGDKVIVGIHWTQKRGVGEIKELKEINYFLSGHLEPAYRILFGENLEIILERFLDKFEPTMKHKL